MVETTRHLADAHCADLVLDLLAPAERHAALAHASSCPECAARLRSHVSAASRMRADLPAGRRARISRMSPLVPLLPALAAAAALVVLLGLPRGVQHVPRTSASWLAMPADGVLFREGAAEDPHLVAGFAAYARHDLPVARRELELARAGETAEQARRVYLAHVVLLEGDAERALALLRSLDWIELPAAVHRPAVELLVQAERATGHPASADSIEHALRITPEWIPVQP